MTSTGPIYPKSCPDHRLPLPLIAHSAAATSYLRWIRANAVDYSGYPDCRPEFFDQVRQTIEYGSKLWSEYGVPIRVETPIIQMSKAEIARLGTSLKAPLEYTWSCYEGRELPCGMCDSCLLRARGFQEAGIEDPLLARLGAA